MFKILAKGPLIEFNKGESSSSSEIPPTIVPSEESCTFGILIETSPKGVTFVVSSSSSSLSVGVFACLVMEDVDDVVVDDVDDVDDVIGVLLS